MKWMNFSCLLQKKICPLLEHIAQLGVQLAQTVVHFAHFQVQARMAARHAVTLPFTPSSCCITATSHESLKVITHCCVVVRLCFTRDQPDTTGSCRDTALWTVRLLLRADCLQGAVYIPSLLKHNLSMPQGVFLSQIEDTQHNQKGGDKENSSEDEGPYYSCSWRRGQAKMRKQAATMPATKINNINPPWGTMIILFAIPLLLKKTGIFEESRKFKEHMWWTVQIPAMIMSMASFVIQELNKQAGVFSFVSLPIARKVNCMETDFSPAVDFQQRLYPQHFCPAPIGKVMFLSFLNKICDSEANHHVHGWSSHCAKPYGGQGQVPHSSTNVFGCNSFQACSNEHYHLECLIIDYLIIIVRLPLYCSWIIIYNNKIITWS